jgi:hypothetical protein
MHNQPEAPVPAEGVAKKKQTDGPPPPPPPPPPPVNPGEDESNVGNKLLKMMGWKEGTGLGTSGTGRVEPMFVHFAVWRMLTHFFSPAVKQPSMHRGRGLEQAKGRTLGSTGMGTRAMCIWHRML